jgi:RNA 2',3'-cyclic 3'-phosphodiesterase
MRLFFAIPLPDDLKQLLHQKSSMMQNKFPPGVWVKPVNYHITLSFLGDIDPHFLKKLTEMAKFVASGFTQQNLELQDMDAFPSRRNVKTLICTISKEDWLDRLGTEMRRHLFADGIKVDNRFQPHVTIARFRDPVKQHYHFPWDLYIVNKSMIFERFELVESVLKPTGAQYTTVATFKVLKEDKTDGRKG